MIDTLKRFLNRVPTAVYALISIPIITYMWFAMKKNVAEFVISPNNIFVISFTVQFLISLFVIFYTIYKIIYDVYRIFMAKKCLALLDSHYEKVYIKKRIPLYKLKESPQEIVMTNEDYAAKFMEYLQKAGRSAFCIEGKSFSGPYIPPKSSKR